MKKNIKDAMKRGEEVAKEYNPNTLIRFPFGNIFDKENISFASFPDDAVFDDISGAVRFFKEDDNDRVQILVNTDKSDNRQYFTIAHELGHYFLHYDEVKKKSAVFDVENVLTTMYRMDMGLSGEKEVEANHFAGSLLMPRKQVLRSWKTFGSIEKCAEVFLVSESAMAVRLDVLGLVD